MSTIFLYRLGKNLKNIDMLRLNINSLKNLESCGPLKYLILGN